MMLSAEQKQSYADSGYLVLEHQVPDELLEQVLADIENLKSIAYSMEESDDRIDLEPTHSKNNPRIRRIKLPHQQMDSCRKLIHHECILQPARDLLGPDLRLQSSKLNMKSAGFGAAVEWHQDWAFYPHTNDDILAVGVLLDDMTLENGALLMLPGSHKGPVHDHHNKDHFVGAIRPSELNLDIAQPVIAPAGSISLHHVRLVHGSDINRSGADRKLLLFEITAADAFPITGGLSPFISLDEFNSRLLCGNSTNEPRLTPVPVRMPQPLPDNYGSIYEVQKKTSEPAFESISE
ncbi:MAG: ectoine hydroxylase [Parasphingorhabdus sp.]|jgi:ectoine hydroxylase